MGETYDEQMDKERRKVMGAFYTPEAVIDFILNKTVAHADLLDNPFPKILDPACGCGYFLLKAYDLLYQMFVAQLGKLRSRYAHEAYILVTNGESKNISGEEYWSLEYLPYHIISYCLYGADLDGQAVQLASEALTSKAGTTTLKPHLVVGDSLIKWEAAESNYTDDIQSQFWSQCFDYVIGNPPYISYGLRGTKTLERQRYQELIAAYPGSAEYKLSLYALFFERGVELLATGGKLAYITPDSFLSGRYFSRLRYFLAQNAIISITMLEFTVFPDAAIGKGVITVLSKKSNAGNEVCVEAATKEEQLKSGQFTKQFTYEQRYLDTRFSLFFNKTELEVFQAMQAFTRRFYDCCRLYSGCIARYGQKSIVSLEPVSRHRIYDYQGNIVIDDCQAEKRWKRLVGRGAYIRRYQVKPVSHYIYIHEDETIRRKYAKSGFELEKYAREKLFIRQTGEDLVAAYDNSGSFCLNNMHILYSINTDFPVKLLLALINSRLYNYYYQCITRESRRVLPQVDIDTVKYMPVIPISNTKQVIAMVDELIGCYASAEELQMSPKQSRYVREIRNTLEKEILDNIDIKPATKNEIMQYSKNAAMFTT